MNKRSAGFLLILFMFSFAGQLAAEARREGSGGQDPMRKAQLMMRQLSQEKAQLEAENTGLNTEIKDLHARVKELERDLSKTSSKLGKSRASNEKLVGRVRNDNEKMRGMIEKYRNVVQLLRMEKANVAHLTNAIQERNDWIDMCKVNNDKLYDINLELVDSYQNKSIWQELAQADPLTGLGDVKLEVIAEEYRYRLEDLQVATFKSDATAASKN